MPTASDAAAAARTEAQQWWSLSERWSEPPTGILEPSELAVLPEFPATTDIARRMNSWGHTTTDHRLGALAAFAAALGRTEAEAWDAEDRVVATRAYADRRFLVGDRILPWAVPWLDTIGRCVHAFRDKAHHDRDVLLGLGDEHRPLPALVGPEGVNPPGHDGYGPVETGDLSSRLASLTGGLVVLKTTAESVAGQHFDDRASGLAELLAPQHRETIHHLYVAVAARWRHIASLHQGSASAWLDLAVRATHTAELASE